MFLQWNMKTGIMIDNPTGFIHVSTGETLPCLSHCKSSMTGMTVGQGSINCKSTWCWRLKKKKSKTNFSFFFNIYIKNNERFTDLSLIRTSSVYIKVLYRYKHLQPVHPYSAQHSKATLLSQYIISTVTCYLGRATSYWQHDIKVMSQVNNKNRICITNCEL